MKICTTCGVCKAQSGRSECVVCKLDRERPIPTAPPEGVAKGSNRQIPDDAAAELYFLWKDETDANGEPLSMRAAVKIMQASGRFVNPATGQNYGLYGGQNAIRRMIAKHGNRDGKKYRKLK